MKACLLFFFSLVLFALPACKKESNQPQTPTVLADSAYVKFGECALFQTPKLTVCFVDAYEYRCPCTAECIWAGAVDISLKVTGTNVDTTLKLTTMPYLGASDTAIVGNVKFHLKSADPADPCDLGNYATYKALIEVL